MSCFEQAVVFRAGRFATAAELLSQDPSSVLFRLENGFKTGRAACNEHKGVSLGASGPWALGSNMVVVGTGGAGKTETILLAMENTRKSKADRSCQLVAFQGGHGHWLLMSISLV